MTLTPWSSSCSVSPTSSSSSPRQSSVDRRLTRLVEGRRDRKGHPDAGQHHKEDGGPAVERPDDQRGDALRGVGADVDDDHAEDRQCPGDVERVETRRPPGLCGDHQGQLVSNSSRGLLNEFVRGGSAVGYFLASRRWTRGLTSVASRVIDSIRCSCGRPPRSICRKWRMWPMCPCRCTMRSATSSGSPM